MKFSEVAQSFQAIESVSKRLEITRLLADLFRKASPHEAEIIANLSLGQLYAPYIGTQFNIAEKSLIKALAEFLSLSEHEIEKLVKKAGDSGEVIGSYEWGHGDLLSVLDVFKALQAIEQTAGTGSQEERNKELLKLFKNLDPCSAKYIVRIVLGKLRLGFSDMTIIDALSWMEAGDKSLRHALEDAYNICADIGLIAHVLKKDGIEAIKTMHIKLGIPIRPAAAERLPTARAIIEKLGHCIAEPKLDGFRLQIHVDKKSKDAKIHFFSRNLIDMSHMFPDLTKEFLKLDVETLICEGEAICYDPSSQQFLPFQETVKRKRKHGIEEAITEFPLKVFVFDLLYLNGHEYLNKPFNERRHQLAKIMEKCSSDAIILIKEKKIDTADVLENYFIDTVSTGLEGLVVKRPHAIYQPGKRNFNWIKLKRQESEAGHLEDTLDCVILGYYAGKGKRTAFGVGAFLVGVYNKADDNFQTVAKIGTGMKDAEWKELKKKCDAIAVLKQPKNVECAKELAPDVWVSPEIVVLIRADEITQSPLHTAGSTASTLGYALRFPRFMGYRPDKGAYEATTAHEIKRLYDDQFRK